MVEEADLIFTVPVGIPFGGLGEHETLMIALFLPFVFCRNQRVPWTIKVSDWVSGTYICFDLG